MVTPPRGRWAQNTAYGELLSWAYAAWPLKAVARKHRLRSNGEAAPISAKDSDISRMTSLGQHCVIISARAGLRLSESRSDELRDPVRRAAIAIIGDVMTRPEIRPLPQAVPTSIDRFYPFGFVAHSDAGYAVEIGLFL